jgi:hypothetical protein
MPSFEEDMEKYHCPAASLIRLSAKWRFLLTKIASLTSDDVRSCEERAALQDKTASRDR